MRRLAFIVVALVLIAPPLWAQALPPPTPGKMNPASPFQGVIKHSFKTQTECRKYCFGKYIDTQANQCFYQRYHCSALPK